jgi:cytochrome c oxidase subunit II
MNQIPSSILALVAGIVITLVSFWYGQNNNLMPVQASEQAPLVDGFFNVMVGIATALFIVVEGTILYFVIKYRQRAGDETDGAPVNENFALEVFWTAIPAILVMGLGVYSVEVYRDMGGFDTGHQMMAHVHHAPSHKMSGTAVAAPLIADGEAMPSEPQAAPVEAKYGLGAAPDEEGKPADVSVNVTGMQFAWIFNYPDSGVVSGELHVPVGKTVALNLTATDVIHSLWVPQFRIKQDVMPGLPSQLNFVATKTGQFDVVCTELCGGYHGGMRTRVIVHTPQEYDTWLQENQIAQQQDMQNAVAVNPASLSTEKFLAPYAAEMGITADTLAQIHP